MPARACRHCGSPVPEGDGTNDFCCRGCEFVFGMIEHEGMEHFYDLKGDKPLEPVRGRAFTAHDWSWLDMRRAEAEAAGHEVSVLHAGVDGVSCIGCLWLIEKLFQREPGGMDCDVHPGTGKVRLRWKTGQCDLTAFARKLQQFGYTLAPAARNASSRTEAAELRLRLGLTSAFMMNCMAFTLPSYLGMGREFFLAGLFELIAALSATLALLTGGSYFIVRAVAALRHGVLHMDFPIALGVLVAWTASMVGWLGGWDTLVYFDFVALFLTLMLAGRLLQIATVERHRQRAAQAAVLPRALTDADGAALPVESIVPGVRYTIPAGGVVPVASRLDSGDAELSLEWINGETETQHWSGGRRVPSGAVNVGRNALSLCAEESWPASLLHKLAGETDNQWQARRPLLERVLRYYVIIVLVLALGGAGYWLGSGAGWIKALQVLVSVLVVSCPCSTGLALPLADDLARSRLQRAGVFLRRDDFWARLAGVKHVLFDKTGTLTMERPDLLNPEELDKLDAAAIDALRLLVAGSLHPVSRRLLESIGGRVPERLPDIDDSPGQGMRMVDEQGRVWSLGRPGFCAIGHIGGDEDDTVFRRDGEKLVGFRFRDTLRPESTTAVDWLRARGMRLAILSGDKQAKVDAVADQLGLGGEMVHAGMSPEQKADWVEQADPAALTTLFLGDGANDSLACQRAACSGTPMVDRALLEEKADFYFTGRGLGFLPVLFLVADVRRRAVRRIFTFAALYNFAAVLVCLAGAMHPVVAAIAMPTGSILTLALTVSCFRSRERSSRS